MPECGHRALAVLAQVDVKSQMKSIFVTGGAGFIGAVLVKHLLSHTDCDVIVVDNLTYAGDITRLDAVAENKRMHFERSDIGDNSAIKALFDKYRPCAVFNLAAESHVDNSIASPQNFVATNIVGTFNLLNLATEFWRALPESGQHEFRFFQISTDEVFGDLHADDEPFTEQSPYNPSSPYSASKAGADMLVKAWHRTYGLPTLISYCSNNYGPFQHSEKFLPTIIEKALKGQNIPVYGDGQQIRDWLHVEDHARALVKVWQQGEVGECYAIGGNNEQTNLAVVEKVLSILSQRLAQTQTQAKPRDLTALITFVTDRAGHDRKYAINAAKLTALTGWTAQHSFAQGLTDMIDWHLERYSE